MKLYIENVLYELEDILSINVDSIEEKFIRSAFSFLQEWNNSNEFIFANTSGSTGTPKTIKLNKSAMRISAQATETFFRKPRIVCSPLSAQFIAGKMMLVRAIEWDAEIHLIRPQINPIKDLERQFDFMVMTPHQLAAVISDGDFKKLELVEKLLLGGSPIGEELQELIREVNTEIYMGYGMTETMSHVAVRRINGKEKSESYHAVDGIDFAVDNRDCLIINSDGLLPTPLVTNDVVSLLNSKEFIWKSRYDHVINSGGIKVFPEEVEKMLNPLIEEDFYIAGMAHSELGEEVVLYIESANWSDAKSDNLLKKVSELVSDYRKPRKIISVKQFSYTKNGKLIREY